MIFLGATAITGAKTTIIEVDSNTRAPWAQAQIVTIRSCKVVTRIATPMVWATAKGASKEPSKATRRNRILPHNRTPAKTTEAIEAMDTEAATTATSPSPVVVAPTTISTGVISTSSISHPIQMVQEVTTTVAITTTSIMATMVVAITQGGAAKDKQPARSATSSYSRTQRATKLTMRALRSSTCSRCRAISSNKTALDTQTEAVQRPKPPLTTTPIMRTTMASRLTGRPQLQLIRIMGSSKRLPQPMATTTTSNSNMPITTTTSSSNSSHQHSTAKQQTRNKLTTVVQQQLEAQDSRNHQVSRQKATKAPPIEECKQATRESSRDSRALLECKLRGPPASECKCRRVHMLTD